MLAWNAAHSVGTTAGLPCSHSAAASAKHEQPPSSLRQGEATSSLTSNPASAAIVPLQANTAKSMPHKTLTMNMLPRRNADSSHNSLSRRSSWVPYIDTPGCPRRPRCTRARLCSIGFRPRTTELVRNRSNRWRTQSRLAGNTHHRRTSVTWMGSSWNRYQSTAGLLGNRPCLGRTHDSVGSTSEWRR